jgi:putative ABC transport system permease protein
MTLWQLAIREIRHRQFSFVMAVVSVSIAVGGLVGAQTLLRADRVITENLLAEKETEVEAAIAGKEEAVKKAGADLQDAMRKHMKGLGFNILILPKDQSRSELLLHGMTATMPESYVERLAESKIVTVNHLLPSVTRQLQWPEQNREVILIGTRGEVPIQHRGLKKPLLQEVAEDKMVVGYQLHKELGLSVGDSVTLLDQQFTISKLHPERGSTDDVTIWINLRQAQKLLEMENLINAILALECDCAGDRISAIRDEIEAILPGTQVIEKYSQALARAEARAKAKEVAESALEQEKEAGIALLASERQSRDQIEQQHSGFAAVLIPLVFVGSAATIFLLSLMNTRQRTEEIGILRAIGMKSRQIVRIFLLKAGIVGITGGLIGICVGCFFGVSFGGLSAKGLAWQQLFDSGSLLMTLAIAPFAAVVLSGLASWIPAVIAAQQDPAFVLQKG